MPGACSDRDPCRLTSVRSSIFRIAGPLAGPCATGTRHVVLMFGLVLYRGASGPVDAVSTITHRVLFINTVGLDKIAAWGSESM
jgi:hypothetical protein